jgi:small conductance mechanosensitive channel
MDQMTKSWSETVDPVIASTLTVITTYGLSVIAAIVILIFGLWLSGRMAEAVRRAAGGRRYSDPTLVNFFASLVRYLVIALTVIAVLDRFGVETTSLVAVIGAAGLAIGLALQGTLSHIAAGIMLLSFRPFRVGDHIELAGFSGVVKEITLFVTTLNTPNGIHMIVPNGLIWGQWILNHSHKDPAQPRVDGA